MVKSLVAIRCMIHQPAHEMTHFLLVGKVNQAKGLQRSTVYNLLENSPCDWLNGTLKVVNLENELHGLQLVKDKNDRIIFAIFMWEALARAERIICSSP
jgi:hypothetical protein